MEPLAEIAGALLEGLLGAARPRPAPGTCARCRKAPAVARVAGAGPDELVCEACARRIARNHRSGLLFFLALAALMVVAGVVTVLMGAR